MARVIHKYPIPHNSTSFAIRLPKEAKIIHVDVQRGDRCIWAELDSGLTLEPNARHFELYGTGQVIPENRKHITTWQNGPIVLHLYEKVSYAR